MAEWWDGLSVRAANALLRAGVKTRAEARGTILSSWRAFLRMHGVGEVTFIEICKWLEVADPRPPRPDGPPPASDQTIERALRTLSRAGWKILVEVKTVIHPDPA